MESLSLLLLLSLIVNANAQQCFWPDGSKAEDRTPCNGSATTTHCCAEGSACVTNGLCFLQWDSSLNTGACTQKQWSDKTCFQQCIQTIGRTDWEDTLYRCNDNEWCCSAHGNTTSCCQDTTDGSNLFKLPDVAGLGQIENGTNFAAGLTIAAISALQTQTSVTVPSATAAKSSTTPAKGSPSASSTQALQGPQAATSTGAHATPAAESRHEDDTNRKVAAVGAGVGVGVGVPLLAALGTVLFLYLREKRLTKDLMSRLPPGTAEYYQIDRKVSPWGEKRLQELQGELAPPQLSAGHLDTNAELESSMVPGKQ